MSLGIALSLQIVIDWTIFLSIIFGAILTVLGSYVITFYSAKIQDEKWLRDNLYNQIHKEILEIVENHVIRIEGNYWKTFDRSRKFQINSKMRNILNEYASKRDQYQSLAFEFNRFYKDNAENIVSVVREALPSEVLTDNKNKLIERRNENGTVGSSFYISSFVDQFKEPFLSGKRGKELFTSIIKNCGKSRKETFEAWDKQYPDFFDNIASALKDNTGDFYSEYHVRKSKVDQAKSDLEEMAQRLKKPIEIKLGHKISRSQKIRQILFGKSWSFIIWLIIGVLIGILLQWYIP